MANKLIDKSWPFVQKLSEEHPDAEVFLVGGAVRDTLLKRPIKDYDFVIRMVEIDKLIATLKKSGDVDLVGKRFGVIKFRPSGKKVQYDIALPRREFSLSFTGAYRDFKIQSDHTMPIDQDLSRRDFSINAMAYNVLTDELVDPFFGQKDVKQKTIRAVGSAVTRFQEDYSRMLRAIRFACQLDFSLSRKTSDTIQKLAPHINDKIDDNWVVAREVISQEFLKAFDSNPTRSIELLNELDLLKVIFPELKELQTCKQSPPFHNEGSVYQHTLLALQAIESAEYKKIFPEPVPLMSKLGILFHDIGKPSCTTTDKKGQIHFYNHGPAGGAIVKKLCQRQKLGSSAYYPFNCDHLAWIVKNHLFSVDYSYKPSTLVKLEELFYSDRYPSQSLLHSMLADQLATIADKGIDRTGPFMMVYNKLKELAPDGKLPKQLITGDDVIKSLKIKPGPKIKEILDGVREEQLKGHLTSKKEALKFAKII